MLRQLPNTKRLLSRRAYNRIDDSFCRLDRRLPIQLQLCFYAITFSTGHLYRELILTITPQG